MELNANGWNSAKRLLIRDFNDGDIEDEIREAFRMFDKEGNGFIPSVGKLILLMPIKNMTFTKRIFIHNIIINTHYFKDLMEIMTSIGDVLTFEEADVSKQKSKNIETGNSVWLLNY